MANTKGTSVINTPQGGGAQSGLGEKFSPDLFTGTGNFSVPIAVPPGRNGFQPELTMGYSSGNGNGPFGMGWAIGVPGVTRKTSKGIPIYKDDEDIFILSGAEDLVPVNYEKEILSGNIVYEKTTYQPRTEGLYARIVRHKKTSGEHYWEVRSKDGLISWYGTPDIDDFDNYGDPAVIADPEKRDNIFAWHLTKTQDPFGNIIVYTYERDIVTPADLDNPSDPHVYDQLYLSKIEYVQFLYVGNPSFMFHIQFVYEERPDPFSAYKQGFEVRTTKRCTKIDTNIFQDASSRIKTYHFSYDTTLPLNAASLLRSVKVEGYDQVNLTNEYMPPLEFTYSTFNPVKRELQEIKGPLPINSLSDPGFELVDLDGNGLLDLLQLNGTARYWTNLGNGKFSSPRELNIAPSVQLGTPGVRFFDASGDGRTDLLVNNGIISGYFPGAFHKIWDSNNFRSYTQIPSFSFSDPEVQLMDLDGDGITDVLRNGSKFECFYNDPDKGFNKVRTAIKTFANFSFADPRIRFVDMTGDGLTDIVLISSGRVQYWPNMGYGRFGRKVNMRNAPVFPEQYDPAQVLIGDLDGDGQADIAFIEANSVTLYVNQSGNGFSDPIKIPNTPRVYNPKSLRIVDILGTGQSGLLWSFGPDAGTPGKMYFLDLTKGNKPYVLEQMNNNMGSITRVSYGSSVYHYLRDQVHPNTRWKTDLPFPVQVVNKVEVLDLLSGGKLTTVYNYHNGYWDGVEREFRGFAHVDNYDSEEFNRFNEHELFSDIKELFDESVTDGDKGPKVTSEHFTPPTLTKSWFYVGAVGDGYSRWKEPDFSDEYWSGDPQILKRPKQMTDLLASLPRWARREALRTLRGTLLRSELYALDKSSFAGRPYTVTESLMSLRLDYPTLPSQVLTEVDHIIDPITNVEKKYHPVFFPFNIAQRTTQYERGTDPMHSFSFTKEYDNYGQPQGQLSACVPRNFSPAAGVAIYSGPNNSLPDKFLGTYSISDFIYVNTSGQYMVNRVKRARSWDASAPCTSNIFDYRDSIFASTSLPVIGWTLNFYDGDSFVGEDFGVLGAYGAQVRSESLVITDAIISSAYASTPQCFETTPDWSTGYPADFEDLLQDDKERLGYVYKTDNPSVDYVEGWYAESTRLNYDWQASDPYPVGNVLETRDVFNNWTSVVYDMYSLLPTNSLRYLYPYGGSGDSLSTTASYNYQVMQPEWIQDENGNYTYFSYSPLALLTSVALVGNGSEGDYVTTGVLEPSTRMEYDFFAFMNSGDPVWVKTIQRKYHYQQFINDETITKVEYSDGFGRLLQTRVQAEDVIFGNASVGSSGLPADQTAANQDAIGIERDVLDPLNVVVSGWKVYNNKGWVVEQYEPYFDKGFDFTNPTFG